MLGGQTIHRHLSRNKLNTDNFTCDEWKDIFNSYICDFAYKNKLGNRSTVSLTISLTFWPPRPVSVHIAKTSQVATYIN